MASNANAVTRVSFTKSPILATETILLTPQAVTAGATTRASSLVGLPGDLLQGGVWDGVPFRVSIYGKAFASASENLTFACYLNTAAGGNTNLTTFTNDLKIITTSTMASGGAAWIGFYDSSICMWISTGATATGNTTGSFVFFPDPGGLKAIPTTSAVLQATAVIGNSGTPVVSTLANLQLYCTALTGTADSTSIVNLNLQIESLM
jgi:hypothetical protein